MTTINTLLNDNRRGATAIFQEALALFANYQSVSKIQLEAEQLKNQFPVMGVFQNFFRQIKGKTSLTQIQERITYFQSQLDRDFNRVVERAAAMIENNFSLMTISHSSYVRELVLKCKNKVDTVYCLRSAPGNEGAELARILNSQQVRAEIIADNNASRFLQHIRMVVIGADLLSDHFFINKIGTRHLVESARQQSKKVWVLADQLRYLPEANKTVIPELFEIIPLQPDYRIFW